MPASLRRVAAPLTVVVVRAALLPFVPVGESLGEVLPLDLAALVIMLLAEIFGHVLGGGFGTLALTAVGLGLPIAGLGALAEHVSGRHASNLSGLFSLFAVGVGFWLAAPGREERFDKGLVLVLGAAAFAAGTKVMMEGRDLATTAWLGGPYAAAAVVALVLFMVRPRP